MWTDWEMNKEHSLSIPEMLLYNVIENVHEILLTVLLQMQEIHVTCTHGQVNDQRGMQKCNKNTSVSCSCDSSPVKRITTQQTEDFPCAKNPNNYKRRSRLAQAVTLAAGV